MAFKNLSRPLARRTALRAAIGIIIDCSSSVIAKSATVLPGKSRIEPLQSFVSGIEPNDDYAEIQQIISRADQNEVVLINKVFNLNGAVLKVDNAVTLSGSGSFKNGTLVLGSRTTVAGPVFDACNIIVSGKNVSILSPTKLRNLATPILGAISAISGYSGLTIGDGVVISNISAPGELNIYGAGINLYAQGETISSVKIGSVTISEISGPAAISVVGHGEFDDFSISGAIINKTNNFGIEIFQTGGRLSVNGSITEVKLSNIGGIRLNKTGAGCTGIYTNGKMDRLELINNKIIKTLENGIEGYFALCEGNYIEDPGSDQLQYPIAHAGTCIYGGGPTVRNNILVNPGEQGALYEFNVNRIRERVIQNNVAKNVFSPWMPSKRFEKGDLTTANDKWYICDHPGISGVDAPSGTGAGVIDGSIRWNYKKPLSKTAFGYNSPKGISNISFVGNVSLDFEYGFSLPSFLGNIEFLSNKELTTSLFEKPKFIGGSGSRICEELRISPISRHNYLDNGDFAAFSGVVPDHWAIKNGPCYKVTDRSTFRNIVAIRQLAASSTSVRLEQSVSIDSRDFFVEMCVATNNGIKVTFEDTENRIAFCNLKYIDRSELYITLGCYVSLNLNRTPNKITLGIENQGTRLFDNYLNIKYVTMMSVLS